MDSGGLFYCSRSDVALTNLNRQAQLAGFREYERNRKPCFVVVTQLGDALFWRADGSERQDQVLAQIPAGLCMVASLSP